MTRYVYAIAAILGVAAAFACCCRAPLIWDGAYQFDMTLALQHPYVYLTRFHTWFLWWPTVWASRFTDNVGVLQTLFGLPFLLAPMAGVWLSWWMVRDPAPALSPSNGAVLSQRSESNGPQLIVWAVFGIAAATLPGQIFVINDSIFQQHLFWPVFLGMLVPVNRPRRIVRAVLIVFQLAHPLGVPLLFGGAVAVAAVAIADRTNRRQLLGNAALLAVVCALAVAKILLSNHIDRFHDTYAAHQATWEVARSEWQRGVLGAPIHGLSWIWAAGALVLVQALLRRGGSLRVAAAIAAVVCAAAGSVCWLIWAKDPTGESWMGAVDYRRWIGPLTAPFFLMATIEAFITAWSRRKLQDGSPVESGSSPAAPCLADPPSRDGLVTIVGEYSHESASARRTCRVRGRGGMESPALRGGIGVILAGTFALVLGMQSATWRRLTDKLMAQVNTYQPSVIVPYSAPQVAWFKHTPLGHWATGNYVAVMQGKTPARVFLDPVSERNFRKSPPRWDYFAADPDAPPGEGGWFDFRPLLLRLSVESTEQAQQQRLSDADESYR